MRRRHLVRSPSGAVERWPTRRRWTRRVQGCGFSNCPRPDVARTTLEQPSPCKPPERPPHGTQSLSNSRNAASIHSEYGFRQEDGYRCFSIFCQDLCAAQILIHFIRAAQYVTSKSHCFKHRFGYGPEGGKTAVANVAGIVDQHQNWNLKLQRSSGERVAAVQEAGVLHDNGGFLAGKVSARADADSFFFTAQWNVFQILIFFHCAD